MYKCFFWQAELYDRIEILETGLPNFSVQSEKAVKHIKRPCEKSQIWLIFSQIGIKLNYLLWPRTFIILSCRDFDKKPMISLIKCGRPHFVI